MSGALDSTHVQVRPAPQPGFEPGAMVGEYRIEGELGSGGMGHVYAAVHPVIAKRAAIKVLRAECSSDASAVDRFVFEARAVNEIQHPNIVDIFSFGELPDGRHYFVMEWLRGVTLRQRAQRAPLSIAETCDVLLAVANALGAAHSVGIVHRDLKPDNVFLVDVRDNPRPLVKLLDFGIAKLMGNEPRRDQTAAGVFMGTPLYTSPEQARGIEVDHRTDLYALGVMAFELLTGRLPFDAESGPELLVKHIHDPAPAVALLVPNAPAELTALVQSLLAKDPAKRPTLDDVRARLVALATGAPTASPHLTPERPRGRRAIALGVGLLAALAAVTIFIATRDTNAHHVAPAPRDAVAAPVRERAPLAVPVPVLPPPTTPVPAPAAESPPPAVTPAQKRPVKPPPSKHRTKQRVPDRDGLL